MMMVYTRAVAMAKKWSDPEYILKAESTGFDNRLDMKYQREKLGTG